MEKTLCKDSVLSRICPEVCGLHGGGTESKYFISFSIKKKKKKSYRFLRAVPSPQVIVSKAATQYVASQPAKVHNYSLGVDLHTS